VVTAGQRGDAPRAEALPAGFGRGAVGHVVAGAACGGDAIRRARRRTGARAGIRPDPTRKARKRYDRRRYRNRNVTGRFFRRVEGYRRVATRYERKAADFAGFVWLAALLGELP
jgi:transposase